MLRRWYSCFEGRISSLFFFGHWKNGTYQLYLLLSMGKMIGMVLDFFADPIAVFVGQLDSKVVNPTKFYSFSPSSKSLPESLLMTILFRFSKFAHSTRTCLNILFKKLYNLWRITKLSSCFIILHVIISHEPNRRYFFPFHEKHFLKGNFSLSINLQNLLEIF